MAGKKVLAAVFIGLAAVGVALVFVRVLLPGHRTETDRMVLEWRTTGRPMEVSGLVVDAVDRPVPGVLIQMHGSSAEATTDAEGRFSLGPDPHPIEGLIVQGAGDVEWAYLPLDRGLSCKNGIEFHIRLKAAANGNPKETP